MRAASRELLILKVRGDSPGLVSSNCRPASKVSSMSASESDGIQLRSRMPTRMGAG